MFIPFSHSFKITDLILLRSQLNITLLGAYLLLPILNLPNGPPAAYLLLPID